MNLVMVSGIFMSIKWRNKYEQRPVILVVMDGVGINASEFGNAVALANKPTLDKLWKECPHTQLRAHGLAVGLTSVLSAPTQARI